MKAHSDSDLSPSDIKTINPANRTEIDKGVERVWDKIMRAKSKTEEKLKKQEIQDQIEKSFKKSKTHTFVYDGFNIMLGDKDPFQGTINDLINDKTKWSKKSKTELAKLFIHFYSQNCYGRAYLEFSNKDPYNLLLSDLLIAGIEKGTKVTHSRLYLAIIGLTGSKELSENITNALNNMDLNELKERAKAINLRNTPSIKELLLKELIKIYGKFPLYYADLYNKYYPARPPKLLTDNIYTLQTKRQREVITEKEMTEEEEKKFQRKKNLNLRKAKAIVYANDGKELTEIARDLKTNIKYVKRWIDYFERTGEFIEKKVIKNKKGKITEEIKAFIFEQANQKQSVIQILNGILTKYNLKLSDQAIYNVLNKEGSFKRLDNKPFLNNHHKQERLKHVKQLLGSSLGSIVFTDESMIDFSRRKEKVYVPKRHKAYRKVFVNRLKIMIWGAISLDYGKVSFTMLQPQKTLRHDGYFKIIESLKNKMDNLTKKKWYLIHDNAPCHKKAEPKIKEELGINIISHPPLSPDLNPIEQIWGYMKQHMSRACPKNTEEAYKLIRQAWNDVPLEFINKCINGLSKRCGNVLKWGGDNIGEYPVKRAVKKVNYKEEESDEEPSMEPDAVWYKTKDVQIPTTKKQFEKTFFKETMNLNLPEESTFISDIFQGECEELEDEEEEEDDDNEENEDKEVEEEEEEEEEYEED